jgi:hypothetical protein
MANRLLQFVAPESDTVQEALNRFDKSTLTTFAVAAPYLAGFGLSELR